MNCRMNNRGYKKMECEVGLLHQRITLANTEVDDLDMDEAVHAVDELINQHNKAYVVTPNVDHLVRLENDSEFRKIYAEADLVLTDGQPLVWLSKLYGCPVKEKVSGSDLFPRVCQLSAEKGYSMYFLGAAEGVAAKAAEILKIKYPGLNIVGTYSPPFGFENNTKKLQHCLARINACAPNILIVALGAPKQEKFIYRNRDNLHFDVALNIGATLDFVAGNIKRAPKWMSDIGLEWLYRITQDPKRLAKRYLIDDMQIFRIAWKYRKRL